jgi:hypothetical protein
VADKTKQDIQQLRQALKEKQAELAEKKLTTDTFNK